MNISTRKIPYSKQKLAYCASTTKCKSNVLSCSLRSKIKRTKKQILKHLSRAFSWVKSLLPTNMKEHIHNTFNAMHNHMAFVMDNSNVTIWAIVLGICSWFLEKIELYIFSDFNYLIYLLLMIAYDAYSGIIKAKYLHKQDPEKYTYPSSKVFKDKTFSKLMYYTCVLASLHGLAHFKVKGSEVTIFHALEYAAMITIMATEFWSVQENYAAIGKKTIFLLVWEKVKDFVPSKASKDVS